MVGWAGTIRTRTDRRRVVFPRLTIVVIVVIVIAMVERQPREERSLIVGSVEGFFLGVILSCGSACVVLFTKILPGWWLFFAAYSNAWLQLGTQVPWDSS